MIVVLLVAGAAAAAVDWWAVARGQRRVEHVAKPLTTALAVGVALTSGGDGTVVAWCAAALVLCLAGDVLLMVDRFVPGLASFAAGHVVFVGMFVALGLDRWWLGGLALTGCALVAGTVAVPIVRYAEAAGLGTPVKIYLAVISLMAVVGWGTGNRWCMAGAATFVVSDTVLGWRRFVRRETTPSTMAVVVMVTYHIAIFLLAVSPGR